MKNILIFVGLVFCIPFACLAQSTEEIKDFSDAYQHSLERQEAQKLVSMVYVPLKQRMGGDVEAIQFTENYFHNAVLYGALPSDHHIDKIEWFQSATGQKVYLVTVTRYTDGFPSVRTSKQLDVVIPDGSTGSLQMLALDCISTNWIDSAAPGFSKSEIATRLIGEGLLRKI